jgi:predicted flap endonuclease-1-like 5' DNA nuclease
MASILDIEGVGASYAGKLKAAGVATVEALLEKAASAKGRKELAAASGVDEGKLLEWVNRADLFRIKGVASEYSDLLEAVGVDSPAELAHRVAANLVAKMTEVNAAKKIVRKLPTESQVADWIDQSKKLPKLVTH